MTAVLVAALLASAVSAAAQSASSTPVGELSGGYSHVHDDKTDLSFSRGWTASGARRIGPLWLVAQYDNGRTSFPLVGADAHLTLSGLLGGPRVAIRMGRFQEFAQLLVGGVRGQSTLFGADTSQTRFAAEGGIGIDLSIHGPWAARAQYAYRVVHEPGSWDENERHIAAGLVYSFW